MGVQCVLVVSLQDTAAHCHALLYAATHCNTLQHTHKHTVNAPMSSSSLRRRAQECNAHALSHCNTLQQHTATHCNNTLQHTRKYTVNASTFSSSAMRRALGVRCVLATGEEMSWAPRVWHLMKGAESCGSARRRALSKCGM